MEVVGEARDGLEAIACVEAVWPDVVVMDVSMPKMDGAEATRRISREHPQMRVVALTAHEDREHMVKLQHAGAAGYVVKRSATEDLIEAIRTVVSGGTHWDRHLSSVAAPVQGNGDASAAAVGAVEALSPEEEAVLRALAEGKSNVEIASILGAGVDWVEALRTRIRDKLGLQGRTDMIRYAEQRGWIADR
jgi:DNA-binding NarL/FixJ family response regulator